MKEELIKELPVHFTAQVSVLLAIGDSVICGIFDEFRVGESFKLSQAIDKIKDVQGYNKKTAKAIITLACKYLLLESEITGEPCLEKVLRGKYKLI